MFKITGLDFFSTKNRAIKIWDCLNSHSYCEPYGTPVESTGSNNDFGCLNESGSDEVLSPAEVEILAKKLEKQISIVNFTLLLKEPVVNLHPYSHYLIAPIAASNQHFSIDSHLSLKMKNLCYSR